MGDSPSGQVRLGLTCCSNGRSNQSSLAWSMYQKYDVQTGAWRVQDGLPFVPVSDMERMRYEAYDSNGSQWLVLDLRNDGDELNWRRSRSDRWEPDHMRKHASGFGNTRGGRGASRRRDRSMARKCPVWWHLESGVDKYARGKQSNARNLWSSQSDLRQCVRTRLLRL